MILLVIDEKDKPRKIKNKRGEEAFVTKDAFRGFRIVDLFQNLRTSTEKILKKTRGNQ